MSLSSDEKNLLYIGTDGNGVHFVSANNMKIVRSFCYESGNKQAIRSNSVYALLVDTCHISIGESLLVWIRGYFPV